MSPKLCPCLTYNGVSFNPTTAPRREVGFTPPTPPQENRIKVLKQLVQSHTGSKPRSVVKAGSPNIRLYCTCVRGRGAGGQIRGTRKEVKARWTGQNQGQGQAEEGETVSGLWADPRPCACGSVSHKTHHARHSCSTPAPPPIRLWAPCPAQCGTQEPTRTPVGKQRWVGGGGGPGVLGETWKGTNSGEGDSKALEFA